MKIFLSIVVVLALLFVVGLSVYLNVAKGRLEGERDTLQEEIKGLNRKVTLLQSKYAEKKSLAEGLMRAKRAIEGQKVQAEGETQRLEREKKTLAAEKAALAEACSKRTSDLEATLRTLQDEHAKIKEDCAEDRRRSAETLKEKEEAVSGLKAELASERRTAASEARRLHEKLERCSAHNASLADLTTELLEKYKNKGIFGTIMEKEPFTQVKKVELEHLLQEYSEKIDKHRIEKAE